MWIELKRIIKPKGAIVLFGGQPYTSLLISSNLSMFKYMWIWEKSRGSNSVHSKYQPLKVHEDICVFSNSGSAQGSKSPMIYNPQMTKGRPYNKGIGHNKYEHLSGGFTKSKQIVLQNISGDRYPRSVLYYKCADSEDGYMKLHPTQKPVELLEYILCDTDLVCLMSVNPGFGGQKFIEKTYEKVRKLKAMIQAQGTNTLIEIDGGVTSANAKQLIEAGADVLVAGSFVFRAENPEKVIAELKKLG